MKRFFFILIIGIFSLATGITLEGADAKLSFPEVKIWNHQIKDISGHWAENDIIGFYKGGIVSNDLQGNFYPDRAVTRAEFIKIVSLSLKDHIYYVPLVSDTPQDLFDVPQNAWYEPYLQTLQARGILTGYKDRTFRGAEMISRAEAVKIVVLAFGISEKEINADLVIDEKVRTFVDIPLRAWYAKYINAAVKLNLIKGKRDDMFAPSEHLTRAEAVKMLSNAASQNTFLPKDEIKDTSLSYIGDGAIFSDLDKNQISSGSGGILVAGKEDAPVTMTVFTDFECPGCAYFYFDVVKRLKSEFFDTGRVKLVYRDLPLPQHPRAVAAANALHCAHAQNKVSEMYTLLFEKNANWKYNGQMATALMTFADILDLDEVPFQTCMENLEYKQEIYTSMLDAEIHGVFGTPTIFIFSSDAEMDSSSQVQMNYDEIRWAIENLECTECSKKSDPIVISL